MNQKREEFVIGVSLGTNSSACIFCEGGLLTAISEERLNGEKNTKKFPIKAIEHCLNAYRRMFGDINGEVHIGISSYEVINHRTLRYFGDCPQDILVADANIWVKMARYIEYHIGIKAESIRFTRVDHHTAHRLPAIYMSGFATQPEQLVSVTSDGFGDGTSATIMDVETNQILSQVDIGCSLALVYQFVTGALGFKEHQHEGKITGLAAFGQPKYVEDFKVFIDFDAERCAFDEKHSRLYMAWHIPPAEYNKNIHRFDKFYQLRECIYEFINYIVSEGATREDIACSVQSYVEELTVKWIETVLLNNDIKFANIVLSGGFFANVKVNYRVSQIPLCNKMFVLPPMGDEGTCIGAAIHVMEKRWNRNDFVFAMKQLGHDKLYLGLWDMTGVDVIGACKLLDGGGDKNSSFHIIDISGPSPMLGNKIAVKEKIVDALKNGKIVCISRGGHEFGPRALCNHSILYDAGKYETNKWLNDRLNRTEFMPFAPVVADQFAQQLFYNTEGLEKTLKYMTVTLPARPEFVRDYQAACHVDNTARPQILSEEDNPFMYDILMMYFKETGKKALINTSFNLHNNPIIHDDETAITSFIKAQLDMLVLDNVLIENITKGV